MALSEKTLEAQDREAKLLQTLEAQKRARTIIVPTLDSEVKAKFRSIGEPICLFGERPEDRRDRLKKILARREVEKEDEDAVQNLLDSGKSASAGAESASSMSGSKKANKFYIKASSGLIKFRKSVAPDTFARSSRRITAEKRKRDDVDAFREYEESVAELYSNLGRVQINASQVGDTRPVSSCQFSPDQKWIATGSWSGQAKLWHFPSCENAKTLKGHTERVLEVAFHPKSGLEGGPTPTECNIATASADFTAKLWSMESPDALRTLEGHKDRLSTLAWHPMGRHIGTTSFDHTWRLWDIETGQQLLLQEGHARETYGIDFQCDGALVATGDLGGVGRVWDLRSGKSIHLMQGHVKGITTIAFAPTGFIVATGGYDHTVRVVDLRMQRDLYTIPAHDSLISSVRFAPSSGEFLITSSFDCSCKLWSSRDYSPIATFVGHEGKVLGVDIAPDEKYFVSASYDRTWKLWATEEEF